MNRQFGALSGIAIILIVINHAISMGLTPPQDSGFPPIAGWQRISFSTLQALGVYAVPIFLFISGSFLAYAARGNPPKLSIKFLSTSLQHILIPYLFWSLIFYALVYIHYEESYSLFGYLKNLLVGYPFHFIPLLAFYYLISPVLIRIGKAVGALLILAIGFYQLLLINLVHPGIFGFFLPSWLSYLSPPILSKTLADWAIYFPLGLVYGLHTKSILPWLNKYRWIIVVFTVVFFIIAASDGIFQLINFPISRYITVVTFILIIPAIKRDHIPFARQLEKVGRRSYGIYLTHLIIIDISLLIIQISASRLYLLPFILPILLFLIGLLLPLGVMELVSKAPTRRYYRYIFG